MSAVREHGTYARYNRDGCRCQPCRDAITAMKRAWRERQPSLEAGDQRHGVNGYINYGCRCEVCTEAQANRCADQRQRRKESAA